MNGTAMRVKWIDAAKGIAIIMVVVVHLAQALALKGALSQACSFGAMGVQLFFLMSAYCCCMTWKPERFNKGYWWHKYKRLAPWYVAGIAIYAAYWWMTGNREKLGVYTVGNILANVVFVNDFIPSAQNSIVPGGWSISCIALFVFAFPILIGRFIPRPPCLALCSVGVLGVLVSVLGYRYWGWSRLYAYCNPLNQLIVFALGVVLWECRTMLKLRKKVILTGGGQLSPLPWRLPQSISRENTRSSTARFLFRFRFASGCYCSNARNDSFRIGLYGSDDTPTRFSFFTSPRYGSCLNEV